MEVQFLLGTQQKPPAELAVFAFTKNWKRAFKKYSKKIKDKQNFVKRIGLGEVRTKRTFGKPKRNDVST